MSLTSDGETLAFAFGQAGRRLIQQQQASARTRSRARFRQSGAGRTAATSRLSPATSPSPTRSSVRFTAARCLPPTAAGTPRAIRSHAKTNGSRAPPRRFRRRSVDPPAAPSGTCARCRAAPAGAAAAAGYRASRNRMVPPSMRSTPVMQETSVDFPAPLGPIRPSTSPGETDRLISLSACRPPKRLDTPESSSTLICAAVRSGRRCRRAGTRARTAPSFRRPAGGNCPRQAPAGLRGSW